ncbi:hypothetical protein ABE67_02955 [Cytobacillus firmus]|nr:hypothetical protein [Cytobacillus firmus]
MPVPDFRKNNSLNVHHSLYQEVFFCWHTSCNNISQEVIFLSFFLKTFAKGGVTSLFSYI